MFCARGLTAHFPSDAHATPNCKVRYHSSLLAVPVCVAASHHEGNSPALASETLHKPSSHPYIISCIWGSQTHHWASGQTVSFTHQICTTETLIKETSF